MEIPYFNLNTPAYIQKLLNLCLSLLLAMPVCLQEKELEIRGQVDGLQVGAHVPQFPL